MIVMDNFTAAVIVLAIKRHHNGTQHDNESYVITIKRKNK